MGFSVSFAIKRILRDFCDNPGAFYSIMRAILFGHSGLADIEEIQKYLADIH